MTQHALARMVGLLFVALASCEEDRTGLVTDCIDPNRIDKDAVCTMEYAPVCGCDGKTYDNTCIASVWGGVQQWTTGPCQ